MESAQQKINESTAHQRKRLQIIDESTRDIPQLNRLIVNTTAEDKECCIITYSSINPSYENLLHNLLTLLQTHFKGHILYRIGGWPHMESGCLNHCDVPYAFKICAFQEAYELGYKKILWLDTLVEPLKDLSPIFDHIEQYGCVYRYSFFPFNDHITDEILEDFQLSKRETKHYAHVAAGILGFNFKWPSTVQLLRDWHACAERNKSFNTHFPEQIPLSILLHKYQLHQCAFGSDLVTFSPEKEQKFFFKIDYSKK